jgi:hypothetical protein
MEQVMNRPARLTAAILATTALTSTGAWAAGMLDTTSGAAASAAYNPMGDPTPATSPSGTTAAKPYPTDVVPVPDPEPDCPTVPDSRGDFTAGFKAWILSDPARNVACAEHFGYDPHWIPAEYGGTGDRGVWGRPDPGAERTQAWLQDGVR